MCVGLCARHGVRALTVMYQSRASLSRLGLAISLPSLESRFRPSSMFSRVVNPYVDLLVHTYKTHLILNVTINHDLHITRVYIILYTRYCTCST